MRNFIKPLITCILALFLISAVAEAQQSDYQIKKNYETEYAQIENAISMVSSVQVIDSLVAEIDSLETEYQDHEDLLDNALYPETFSGSIESLKSDAESAQHRLLIIENQGERLDVLTAEVSSYENEIARLNSRTDSLRQEIRNSQESESRLSGLVKNYRESMQQRDRFILDVVDSLLIAYRDMSPQTVDELSSKVESGEIANDQNPLVVISSIIDDNIETLKNSNENFTTEDYLRIYAVQKRFSEAWTQIGDGLIRIYGGENKSKWVRSINAKLDDWRASASLNMWTSLDNYLEQEELDLAAFDNNYSFYIALDNFVKESKKTSEEQFMTSENYEKFKEFNEFWNNKIKDEWSTFVQDGEVLTMSQISSIDSEMTNWRDEAKPRNLVIPILLGFSILIIIGLIIYIFMR